MLWVYFLMNQFKPQNNSINSFFCTGISYKSSGIDVRESVNLDKDQREKIYNLLDSKEILKEALILSTCNRLEIYGVFPHHQANNGKALKTLTSVSLVLLTGGMTP